jgi:hypothetical protein
MYDLESIIKKDNYRLLCDAGAELEKYFKTVIRLDDQFVYAIGEVPMCIVAHVDTVRDPGVPVNLKWKNGVVRNENGILGSDDRAGVYAIFQILSKCKWRPSVLLTNYEECGGLGMKTFVESGHWVGRDRLFIALDRMACDQYVFYGRISRDVMLYVERFGYDRHIGTFSDVLYLTRYYGVPHVNLSIGYYNQHTKNEILVVSHMEKNINRVIKMIENPISKNYTDPLFYLKGCVYGKYRVS